MQQLTAILERSSGKGGLSTQRLIRMLGDARNEPLWRMKADLAHRYYDGKQMTEALEKREAKGQTAIITNLIARAMNAALGQEAKSRTDWKPTCDSNAFADVTEFASERMKEAQRESLADMAIGDAYKSELIGGIGWVEVSRNPNPLLYPYRVEAVHRNMVWWDWRAKYRDLRDARWILRKQWADVDDVAMFFPEARDVLKLLSNADVGEIGQALEETFSRSGLFDSFETLRRDFLQTDEQWADANYRDRVVLYMVHYKEPQMVTALVRGTQRLRFNPKNPLHRAAVEKGVAKLVTGPGYQIRRALFLGPYKLYDEATPLQRFPLIPFWAYADDEDGSPYGLVDGMISPQNEYNERRSRLNWLLKAKQVFLDDDALAQKYNSFEKLAEEIMRPDAVVVLDSKRRNPNKGVDVQENLQLSGEQINVMMDAKQLIQEVPGLYNAFMGKEGNNVASGIALNSLVEQSIVSLGVVADNYRMSRTAVGEVLMDLIVDDHAAPNMRVMVGVQEKQREVILNTEDEQGLPRNLVSDAPLKIALGDVPSTPAYKSQQQQLLGQALSAVGPDPAARAVLLPAFIENSDMADRMHYAKWLRQQAGIPEPGEKVDPAAEDQAKQAMAQQNAVAQEAQQRLLGAQVRQAEAGAAKTEAEAAKINVEAQHALHQADGAAIQNAAALTPQPAPAPTEEDLANEAAQEAMASIA